MLHLWIFCVTGAVAANKATTTFSRIVGGESQSTKPVPYQISLQLRGPSYVSTILQHTNWLHWCGGAIVSRRNVLTAAHCVDGYRSIQLSIWAGTRQLDGHDGVRMQVQSCLLHPDYAIVNTSDLALVRTVVPFTYKVHKVAPIHYTDELIGGQVDCVLSGWGYTQHVHHLRQPNDLHVLNVQTISNDECVDQGLHVDGTGLCTLTEYGKGACSGDTGGPLVRGNLLIGVVSHGTGICGIGLPDVFTRVSVFAEWIAENSD